MDAIDIAVEQAELVCSQGVTPEDWGEFADEAAQAAQEAAEAIHQALQDPAQRQKAREACLRYATAALVALAHAEALLEGLEATRAA